MKNNLFKSVGVILLAFMINGLLSVVTDFILESIGVLPDPSLGLFETWAIVLVLFYRGVYTVFAGFIVAKLAPARPLMHALVLGAMGTLITLIAVNSPAFSDKAPLWFGYVLATLTIPCIWLGVEIQKNWSKG